MYQPLQNQGDNEQPIWSLPKKKFEKYVAKKPDLVEALQLE